MAKPAKQNSAGTVLSVASECAPLIKTGGLADVVGALPAALSTEGWQMRTLLPAYPGLIDKLQNPVIVWEDANLFGGPARVFAGKTGKADGALDMLLLDAPHLFDRAGSIYLGPDGKDWPDNPQRFAALSWAASEIAANGFLDGWQPNILHAHDWQGGLAPAYFGHKNITDVRSLITVHNIIFKGLAPASMLNSLHLPSKDFVREGFEFWGEISALKAGLVSADAITTVSPTYMQELAYPEFGMGLEGVILSRTEQLHGILNGIDLKQWNPKTDPNLPHNFGVTSLQARTKNAALLRKEFKLKDTGGPLFAVVSRLTHQKGLDLLLEALPTLMDNGGQLLVLGSGDHELEQAFTKAMLDNPSRVAVHIGYDEALSHRIFGGADVILVPSRFEPCGLTQMYGLRYGALPLVARTGGLADTVIDANDAALKAGVATGVQFSPITTAALCGAISRTCKLFSDKELWQKLQKRAMRHPVGWRESARKYAALYQNLLT